ncbi:MAG: HAD family hydrolase [Armatimonadota bacterium]
MSAASVLMIFDFDNTLIDSKIDFIELRGALIDLWASAAPLPDTRDALLRLPIRDIVEQALAASPALTDAAWATIEAYETAGLDGAPAMPHARPVLESLAGRGIRLAVLTNNTRPATIRLLESLDLAPLIELTITRSDASALKPDPAGVRLILDRLGPTGAVYLVGDSWIDALAAEAAGIRFIGVGARQAEVEARGIRPWAWVSDLRALLDLDLCP